MTDTADVAADLAFIRRALVRLAESKATASIGSYDDWHEAVAAVEKLEGFAQPKRIVASAAK